MSYDNWSPDFSRLPRLADLANKCPGVTVIVNHLGGRIDPEARRRNAWQKAIDSVPRVKHGNEAGCQMRVGIGNRLIICI